MPSFSKGITDYTPFGPGEYLYSTDNTAFDYGTFAYDTLPSETIDGYSQKILRRGLVLARITAVGANQDKLGPFNADATDGRQTLANIVGLNDTFAPWQLLIRDIEVGFLYHGTANQAKCFEYATGPALVALTNTTAAQMFGKKNLDISFKS